MLDIIVTTIAQVKQGKVVGRDVEENIEQNENVFTSLELNGGNYIFLRSESILSFYM